MKLRELIEAFDNFVEKGSEEGIYINPTNQELSEIIKDTKEQLKDLGYPTGRTSVIQVRAVVGIDGNIYTISPQASYIHEDLVYTLSEKRKIKNFNSWWLKIDSLDNFLCVIYKDSSTLEVSESYTSDVIDSDLLFDKLKVYEKLLKSNNVKLRL